MPKVDVDRLFEEAVRSEFEFLVTDLGYTGPRDTGLQKTYESGDGVTAVAVTEANAVQEISSRVGG